MYARLNMPFALRGYLGTPYVLVNMQTGNFSLLAKMDGFQSTHPSRGETRGSSRGGSRGGFQSTHPSRGETI